MIGAQSWHKCRGLCADWRVGVAGRADRDGGCFFPPRFGQLVCLKGGAHHHIGGGGGVQPGLDALSEGMELCA
jgi:hypothetical protein